MGYKSKDRLIKLYECINYYKTSGLSQTECCEMFDVPISTFAYHINRNTNFTLGLEMLKKPPKTYAEIAANTKPKTKPKMIEWFKKENIPIKKQEYSDDDDAQINRVQKKTHYENKRENINKNAPKKQSTKKNNDDDEWLPPDVMAEMLGN